MLIESIDTISVDASEWDDSGLGCGYPPGKQPDRAYPAASEGYASYWKLMGSVMNITAGNCGWCTVDRRAAHTRSQTASKGS